MGTNRSLVLFCAMVVLCKHYGRVHAEIEPELEPCFYRASLSLRLIASDGATVRNFINTANARYNDTGIHLGVTEYPPNTPDSQGWWAYVPDRGGYDLVHVIQAPSTSHDFKYMTNLTDFWSDYGLFETQPELMRASCVDEQGTIVAVPHTFDPVGLTYSQATFDSWGVSLPSSDGFSSWDDMLAFCQDLRDAGHIATDAPCVTTPGVLPIVDTPNAFDIFNPRLHGQEFHNQLTKMEVSLLDPRFTETLQAMRDGHENREVHIALDPATGIMEFAAGRSPFFVGSGLMFDMLSTPAVNLGSIIPHLRMVAFPPIRTGADAVSVGTSAIQLNLAIPSNSVNKEAARSVLEYLYSPEGIHAYYDNATSLPPIGFFNMSDLDPLRVSVLNMLIKTESIFPVYLLAFPAFIQDFMDTAIMTWRDSGMTDEAALVFATEGEALRQEVLFGQVQPPVADTPPGDYPDSVSIILTTPTPDARVYYTTDGSPPFDGTPEAFPDTPIVLSVAGIHVLRAVAMKDGLKKSELFQGQYNVIVAAPSDSGLSTGAKTAIIVVPIAFVLCIVVPVAFFLHRKIKAKKVSYSIGSEAPLMVAYEQLELVRSIGMGSFGEVFLANWRGSEVAVKKSIQEALTGEAVREFVNETSLVMHLRHRNIVTFMGVCAEPLCIITEFMHRGSLYDVLQNAAITLHPSTAYHWAHEIAQGMAFLHSAHPPVFHRDFKSLNVLLDRNWVPKIADFGLSVALDSMVGSQKKKKKKRFGRKRSNAATRTDSQTSLSPSASHTSLGSSRSSASTGISAEDEAQGSMYWTAPEVLANPAAFEARSDVYAYGITLWEIFSREELYGGANPFAVAMGVLQKQRRPDMDKILRDRSALVPLMEECWAQAPADRPTFVEISKRIANLGVYNADNVVPPAVDTEPTGHVTLLAIAFPEVEAGMALCPEAYAEGLRLVHAAIADAEAHSPAYLWRHDPTRADFAFHSDAQFARFANTLFPTLAAIEWPADLVASEAGSVRWTAAATMGTPDIDRNVATYACAYSGPVVDDVRGMARGSTHHGKVLVGPDLALNLASSPHMSDLAMEDGGVQSSDGLWSIYRVSGYREQQESSSSSSSSVSFASSPAPASSPTPASSSSSPDVAATPTPDPAPAPVLVRASGERRALVLDGPRWLFDAAEIKPALALAERFRVGTFCESLRGEWAGEDVLFKKLLRQGVSMDEQIGFLHNIASARQLNHPRILPIVGCCVGHKTRLFIVPFCQNGSLSDLLGHTQALDGGATSKTRGLSDLPYAARKRIGVQIAEAIAYLHAHGIVFGGIKPKNIVVGGEGEVYITDYGMQDQKNLGTMTQTASATYEAPECLRGEPKSTASDVYSLATVLFEVFGNELYPRGRNSLETAMRLLMGNLPEIPPTVADNERALITACWQDHPAARPTIDDVLDILQRH